MFDKLIAATFEALPKLDTEDERKVTYILDQFDAGNREQADLDILSDRLRQIVKPTGVLA